MSSEYLTTSFYQYLSKKLPEKPFVILFTLNPQTYPEPRQSYLQKYLTAKRL